MCVMHDNNKDRSLPTYYVYIIIRDAREHRSPIVPMLPPSQWPCIHAMLVMQKYSFFFLFFFAHTSFDAAFLLLLKRWSAQNTAKPLWGQLLVARERTPELRCYKDTGNIVHPQHGQYTRHQIYTGLRYKNSHSPSCTITLFLRHFPGHQTSQCLLPACLSSGLGLLQWKCTKSTSLQLPQQAMLCFSQF